MTKLVINSPAEALELAQKIDIEITDIGFASFIVKDEVIGALNLFIQNNWQSLATIDLRNVLELNHRQLKAIAQTVKEHSPSLEVVSINVSNLHGKPEKTVNVSQDKKLKTNCEKYQKFLFEKRVGFSKQNRINFSTSMPQEYVDLLNSLQRNVETELEMTASLAEASLEEEEKLDGKRFLEIIKKKTLENPGQEYGDFEFEAVAEQDVEAASGEDFEDLSDSGGKGSEGCGSAISCNNS